MEKQMDISAHTFTDAEIIRLKECRDNQPDIRLKVRFIAMLMIAEGIGLASIASIIGKSVKTLENWYRQYLTKGIDSLNSFQYKPKQSYLNNEQIDEVIKWVKDTNPSKTKEVREYIKSNLKVVYSVEAVRKLLIRNGLKVLKPKVIPGNPPSVEEQENFKKNISI
jgi:transposase